MGRSVCSRELVFSETVIETLIKGRLHHYSYHSHTEHRSRADKYSLRQLKNEFNGGKRVFKPFYSSAFRFFNVLYQSWIFGWKGSSKLP